MIASSDDSTMAASRALTSSARLRSVTPTKTLCSPSVITGEPVASNRSMVSRIAPSKSESNLGSVPSPVAIASSS